MIVLGVVACFAGYSMFRTMLPMWGFIIGGWVAYTLAPTLIPAAQSGAALYRVGAFLVGGLIGAIVAVPLYFVIIFLSGAALGAIIGIMFGAVIDVGGISTMRQVTALINMSFPPVAATTTQFLLMAIFGVILGIVALNFQKFMIIASSAFVGSAALITGLTGTIGNIANTDMSRAAIMLLGWIVLALLGMFVQFRVLGET